LKRQSIAQGLANKVAPNFYERVFEGEAAFEAYCRTLAFSLEQKYWQQLKLDSSAIGFITQRRE
jgi:uncharacterized membrane protein